jgi:23S rRNA pseudouridine2457 synthase
MVLCQFTKEQAEDRTLADVATFPKDCYSIGRLDKDSEGLLIITNDNDLKKVVSSPKFDKIKTYYVQVEGEPTETMLNQLRNGVEISVNDKKYVTKKAKVKVIEEPNFPPRNPPVRYRASIPTTWLSISITEGKNRQVRKMCAAVGCPVLRLVRYSIAGLKYDKLENRSIIQLSNEDIAKFLMREESQASPAKVVKKKTSKPENHGPKNARSKIKARRPKGS